MRVRPPPRGPGNDAASVVRGVVMAGIESVNCMYNKGKKTVCDLFLWESCATSSVTVSHGIVMEVLGG